MLYVSTECDDLAHLCDRVLVLRHGRIAAEVGRDHLSGPLLAGLCHTGDRDGLMAEARPNGNLVGTSLADRIFVAGRWIRSASDDLIDVVNPATEKTIASVPGGVAGGRRPRRAARRPAAFAEWSAWPVHERVDLLDPWATGWAR